MSEASNRQIRKFNPGTFQSDEELIEQFVVRNRELEIVLEVLHGNIESPSCQHVLVVAPRGRGKTMLLTRAAAEMHQRRTRRTPVAGQIHGREPGDFQHRRLLARGAVPSRKRKRRPRKIPNSRGNCEKRTPICPPAGANNRWRLMPAPPFSAADRLDRKLVLMVENLHSLCESVDEDFGWKLRGVLQSEPKIMLLASATSRFEGLDDAEQPFFELFRIIGLEPLTTEECRLLWQAVSGDAVSGREIRPLEILTGGSPRLLVIVAGFAQHHSLRQLMEELVTLIDEYTEYFRGHLEVCPRANGASTLQCLTSGSHQALVK